MRHKWIIKVEVHSLYNLRRSLISSSSLQTSEDLVTATSSDAAKTTVVDLPNPKVKVTLKLPKSVEDFPKDEKNQTRTVYNSSSCDFNQLFIFTVDLTNSD